ncbi:MAG TPA: ABC transporter substrate-binding protein [Candidatus Binatia bacterium]|jgi:NitT/TauT family transport system substrate-binding protein
MFDYKRLVLSLSFLLVMPVSLWGADRVTLVYSFTSGSTLPLWVAQEAGLFRKYNLETLLVSVQGSARGAQALLSGDADVAALGGEVVVLSALKGGDMKIFAGMVDVFPSTIFAAKNITRPDQLKGKKIAISTFGSSSDFSVRYALRKFGLNPDKDVTILQIGNQPNRFAALTSGAVEATIINPPLTLQAKRLGYQPLADLAATGLQYPQAELASLPGYMKSHEDVMRRLVRAHTESLYLIHTQKAASQKSLEKFMKMNDPQVIEETIESYRNYFPKKPYPSAQALRFVIDYLGEKQPAVRKLNPENLLEPRFVRELDESGFIDQLYRQR